MQAIDRLAQAADWLRSVERHGTPDDRVYASQVLRALDTGDALADDALAWLVARSLPSPQTRILLAVIR